jgi:hypothetical protein
MTPSIARVASFEAVDFNRHSEDLHHLRPVAIWEPNDAILVGILSGKKAASSRLKPFPELSNRRSEDDTATAVDRVAATLVHRLGLRFIHIPFPEG